LDEDEDDMDITVHYRLNGESTAGNLRKRGRGYEREDERDPASLSKRARTSRAAAEGLGASSRGSHSDLDGIEDGEIEDESEVDAHIGKAPGYTANRQGAIRFEAASEWGVEGRQWMGWILMQSRPR
jgi:hypothetical protein